MKGVFISYRRASAAAAARALFEDLSRRFGKNWVFMDVEGIEPGQDFVKVLERTLNSCALMIVLIDPDWLDARDKSGSRRLDDPHDFVRMEVAAAIRRNIRLVPVMIGDAKPLAQGELPDDIGQIAWRRSLRLDFENWETSLTSLRAAIGKDLGKQGLAGLFSRRPVVLSVLVIVVGVAAWYATILVQKSNISSGPVYLAGQGFRDTDVDGSSCNLCPDLVVLPTGVFNMGSREEDPGHRVNESDHRPVRILYKLAVGKFEITREQFQEFANQSNYETEHDCIYQADAEDIMAGKKKPSSGDWRQPGFDQNGHHPVTCVSWADAQSYVIWLAKKTGQPYRLLSESEWEYAARAGTQTSYSWGNEIGANNANCVRCGSQWDDRQTSPVGSFKPNPFGLYDMHGNVREWVQDCYLEDYTGAPENGRAREELECKLRVVRGGSWGYVPVSARSAYRGWTYPHSRINTDGFRVARTLR
jgi:formylglycine-generating enzyme required for sulfatase activity